MTIGGEVGRTAPTQLEQAWGNFLGRIPWNWFLTLTFDPKRRFPVSRELASREAFQWCGLLGFVYRRPVAWVYAVERHRSGAHHAHVLVAGLRQPRWSVAANVWRERNGPMIDVREVYTAPRLAIYVSKAEASGGEVVLSDTLERYRSRLVGEPVVDLISAR